MGIERDEAGKWDGGVGEQYKIESEARVWIPTPPLLISTTLDRSQLLRDSFFLSVK